MEMGAKGAERKRIKRARHGGIDVWTNEWGAFVWFWPELEVNLFAPKLSGFI